MAVGPEALVMLMSGKTVLFRADATHALGTGHVMRCLAWAGALWRQGARVGLLAQESRPGELDWVRQQGWHVISWREPLSEQADAWQTARILSQVGDVSAVVVDHYGLSAQWERTVRAAVPRLVAIDDLANRAHACDVLIDPNLPAKPARYARWASPETVLLLGPAYCLLREEFQLARASMTPRSGQLYRILISFGGSDPTGETAKVLRALEPVMDDYAITVVLGAAYQGAELLKARFAGNRTVTFLQAVSHMASLLGETDLAIGAGGTSSWERCCMGAPGLVINVADNQVGVSETLAREGAIWNLGMHTAVSEGEILAAVRTLQESSQVLRAMSRQAARWVDGLGVERVTARLWS